MNTPKTKIILFVILSLACAAAGGVYVFLWVMNGRLHDRVTALQAEVATEVIRESRAEDAGKFAEDIREDGDLVRSFFISRNNAVTAIETLESLSKTTGATVNITQVDVQGQTPELPGSLIIGLSGNGSWKSVSQLLELLEHLPFYADILSLSLTTSPSTEATAATWNLSARLEIILTQ